MELHPPLHLGVIAIEKGAFGSPSTKVNNFMFKYSFFCHFLSFWYTVIWYQVFLSYTHNLYIVHSLRKKRDLRKDAWRQLQKNAACNSEQVLEATPTIKVRRTRHAGHCWRSKDELMSDLLRWTPSHGRAKVGRPARTYIQQLCADTGYSLENLPGAMDDRGRWWERVK